MATTSNQVKRLITPIAEAKRFMIDCFKAVGSNEVNAEIIASNLLEADYRGHYSHGMNRLAYLKIQGKKIDQERTAGWLRARRIRDPNNELTNWTGIRDQRPKIETKEEEEEEEEENCSIRRKEMYIRDVQGGNCDPKANCRIEKETVATALINGNNGYGAVVGKYAMDLAIKKAEDVGIGLVVARSSNHYGIAGMYALQAINEGLIGLSFTNTSPFMVPTRAKEPALGTNPLSLGAPALNGDSFVLDMATTAVAVGKIELAKRKQVHIPDGWAMNDEGCVETNPDVAYQCGKLMPLGGIELNSGYKGYGLGMLVEVLCGILSGSSYGPNVRKWGAAHELANLGQCFIAINPNMFATGFEPRMTNLLDSIRHMTPVESSKPVLVHGDPERIHMEKVKQDGGLIYVENQHFTNDKLAEELKVKPMISMH